MSRSGVNKVILVGNLGQDPELRSTSSGGAVCNISIATSESWTDKNTGEKKELTEWHKISFFGKLAEIAGQYLRKGSKVYIEGKLKTEKWQDTNGNERYTTKIIAHEMQMLDSRAQNNSDGYDGIIPPKPPQTQPLNTGQRRQGMKDLAQENPAHSTPEFQDDDIPF